MDLGVGQDDPGLGRVLDGKLGAAVLAGHAADGAGQVVAFQGFHVRNLKMRKIGERKYG